MSFSPSVLFLMALQHASLSQQARGPCKHVGRHDTPGDVGHTVSYIYMRCSSQIADTYLLVLACKSTVLIFLCKYCIRTGQHGVCLSCRARAELARIFAKIIETRRATGSSEDDMLQVSVIPTHSEWSNRAVQFVLPMPLLCTQSLL